MICLSRFAPSTVPIFCRLSTLKSFRPRRQAMLHSSNACARGRARGHGHRMAGNSTLIPYARNARTHSEAQIAEIAGSIREFGFTNPVLIAKGDNILDLCTSIADANIDLGQWRVN